MHNTTRVPKLVIEKQISEVQSDSARPKVPKRSPVEVYGESHGEGTA